MFSILLSVFKSKKFIYLTLLLGILGGGVYGWSSLKSNYIDLGYQKAKSEYNQMLLVAVNKSTKEYEIKLSKLREDLKKQSIKEIDRIESNNTIDKEVVTVVEYIEKEVYVKSECNTVEPSLVRMFNKSINDANSRREDRP